jgi:hypothetical protein
LLSSTAGFLPKWQQLAAKDSRLYQANRALTRSLVQVPGRAMQMTQETFEHAMERFVLMRVKVISHPATPHHNSAPRGGCMVAGAAEHSVK